jgi:protein SCO1/2
MANKKKSGPILFLTVSLIVIAVMTFMLVFSNGDQTKRDRIKNYSVLNPEMDFTLKDQDGNDFHLKDHRGRLILLFFGYISCPDICPVTLSKLSKAFHLLGNKADNVLTVFISVDPERDTREKLKEYLKYFKLNMVGLTGTKSEIDQVINAYKGYYAKVETNSAAGYLIDHSDLVYLIDKQGRVVDLIHFDDESARVAQMIKENL